MKSYIKLSLIFIEMKNWLKPHFLPKWGNCHTDGDFNVVE